MKVTLIEWDKRLYGGVHPRRQLQKWARSGRIQPPPMLVGREYMVEETAVYVSVSAEERSSAAARKKLKSLDAANGELSPKILEIINGSSAA